MTRTRFRRILVCLPVFSCCLGAAAGSPASAGPDTALPECPWSEEVCIVHVLNRLGYGPAPGLVDRIGELGLERYIEEQLAARGNDGPEVARRLKALPTESMDPVELLVAFPPAGLLRALGKRLTDRAVMDQDAMLDLLPEVRRLEAAQARRRAGKDPKPAPPAKRGVVEGPARIVLELSQAKLIRAIYSEQQLREVMTDFWFNHFNVYIGKGHVRWLAADYEREAIRPHALGKFRDLLGAVASHPAMLFYLDNWLSSAEGASIGRRELAVLSDRAIAAQGLPPGGVGTMILQDRGLETGSIERRLERQAAQRSRRAGMAPSNPDPRRSGLNENYARELLELHTLGVDGGYTQRDIVEVARCFTGWTLLPQTAGLGFVYVEGLHDRGTKRVLGKKIRSAGQREGEMVLDLLARHPATARFISTKLARRFVTDGPPRALVDRMATSFEKSGGDIRQVLRTMLEAPEFWSDDVLQAKVKTPLDFVASAARATGADLLSLPGAPTSTAASRSATAGMDAMAMAGGGGAQAAPGLVRFMRELGQPLYGAQPPTGYPDVAEDWVSTGALLARMKIAFAFAADRVPGASVPSPREPGSGAWTEDRVMALGQSLLGHSPNTATVGSVLDELQTLPVAGSREGQTRLALGWLIASPDFQRR